MGLSGPLILIDPASMKLNNFDHMEIRKLCSDDGHDHQGAYTKTCHFQDILRVQILWIFEL